MSYLLIAAFCYFWTNVVLIFWGDRIIGLDIHKQLYDLITFNTPMQMIRDYIICLISLPHSIKNIKDRRIYMEYAEIEHGELYD